MWKFNLIIDQKIATSPYLNQPSRTEAEVKRAILRSRHGLKLVKVFK